MNNITRYELEIHEGGGEVVTSETGDFVDYDDYLSQLQQTDALQTSLNNIMNAFGISGEGAHSKLVIEYVHGLVAENAAISDRLQKLIQIINNAGNSYCMCGDSMESHAGGGCGSPTGMFDYHYNAWLESEKETPATDAAITEIKAQGVDEFAAHKREIAAGYKRNGCEESWVDDAEDCALGADLFAANLRAGRNG